MVGLSDVDVNNYSRAKFPNQQPQSNIQVHDSKEPCVNKGEDSSAFISSEGIVVSRGAKKDQKHHFTQTEIQQVISDYTEKGFSTYQLADKFGCHRDTINRLLRKNNVKVSKIKLNSESRKKAASLYLSGLTLAEVAKKMDVSYETVRRALKAGNVAIREPHRYKKKDEV